LTQEDRQHIEPVIMKYEHKFHDEEPMISKGPQLSSIKYL
jgi:hypothetical protein